ncbi:MAG: hypothetical protein ACTHKL_15070 [Streptosporangiaceae bacterium]
MTVGASSNQAISDVGDQMVSRMPSGPRRAPSPPGAGRHGTDGAAFESCWMCGNRQPTSQMVADGGHACADLRWYCRDARACTERWTARPAQAGAR